MKKIFYLPLFFLLPFVACKKRDSKAGATFVGINQTYMGNVIPLFEFSNTPNPQNILYNAMIASPGGTGTTLLKLNYQLTYANEVLSKVQVTSLGSPKIIDLTINANKLITAATSTQSDANFTFAYDQQYRLISRTGSTGTEEYTYNTQGNLELITNRDIASNRKFETFITLDDKINPLFGLPFIYMDYIPQWTYFTLVKHNITSLKHTEYDATGKVADTETYSFTYTYDENGRPLSIKSYYNNSAYNNQTYSYK